MALIVLAVLVALGTYTGLAGPVGDALDRGGAAVFGVVRVVLPPALVWLGVRLVKGGQPYGSVRLGLGLAMCTLSATGSLHVVAGPDGFGRLDEVDSAGGWLGAAVGQPLQVVVFPLGALLVCTAVGLLGALVVTRTTLRVAAGRAARTVRPVAGAARRVVNQATTLSGHRRDAPAGTGPGREATPGPADLYDVGSDPTVLDPYEAGATPVPGAGLPEGEHGPVDGAPGGPDGLDGPDALGPGPSAARAARARSGTAGAGRGGPVAPDGAGAEHAAGAGDRPEQLRIDLPVAAGSPWKLPGLGLLKRSESATVDPRVVAEGGRTLEASLASHGVETRLVGQTVGPTVTRYELELGPGVKVARVTSLHRDIAYAMASADVRILAPIPGRSAIGVEVPNRQRQLVTLGDLFHSPDARAARHPLEVAVGRDIDGRTLMMNLATTPHLLIAGATGSGKSSAINCMVTSLLLRATPDQVRMILVDPKRVEMGQYARLPHLLTAPVTDPKKAANALAWACKEMDRRYVLLEHIGVRDIGGYNAAFDRGDLVAEPGSKLTYERMPFIVVVVDELNDLMMVAARDVEDSICRIAQKARAVGIHLVVATQRPSVNVITGVIKANIPARMAFAVSSATDSRVILDHVGAERLVGQGDMLLVGPSSSHPQRIQSAWVSEDEVRKVVGFWRRQGGEPCYVEGIEGDDTSSLAAAGGLAAGGDEADDEALVRQAMELVVRSQLGSTSMLQRKLKVGFARAGRLMDLLEQRGIVGPSEGSKARAVLMTVEELDGVLAAERDAR